MTTSKEQALLITVDKDFGDLIFRKHYKSVGVILVRFPEVLTAQEKTNIIVEVIKRHDEELFFSFTVITPERMRVTKMLPEQNLPNAES